jgi:uncharacterized membrane protein
VSVVLTALAATLSMQVGYFMWKVSAAAQPRIGSAPALQVARSMVTDWRWMGGLAATIVGWVLFIQATAIGDISLVQPLMTVGDVFLIFLAVAFLHERLDRREWLGIVLTVAGAATLATDPVSSSAGAADGSRLLMLVAAAGAVAAALLWAVSRGARAELGLALTVGLAFGCGAMLTKAMTVGALDVGETVVSWRVAIDPLMPAIVAANVVGLTLLQAAFQRGRAAVIVPLQLAVTNGLTVAAGMLVFLEHVSALRWLGIGTILVGTALLHQSDRP